MSQQLPVIDFKQVKNISEFSQDFIESFNYESDRGYSYEVDVQYPEILCKLQNDLPFLSDRMKIEKFKKLVAILLDKEECVIHIRNLNQALQGRTVVICFWKSI